MGRHYIPQFYLRGFSEGKGTPYIWVYEKGSDKPFRPNIKNIAQQTKFYSDKTETYLANDIENPTIPVIEKIKNHSSLSSDERRTLADFMIVLVKRVPAGLNRAEQWYGEISEKVYDDLESEINRQIIVYPSRQNILKIRKKELQQSRKNDTDKPKDVWEGFIPSEMTSESSKVLLKMTWQFLYHDKKSVFLTSDNPVFYFQWMGIGKRESEVTFPITKHITLWATWRNDLIGDYARVKDRFVREINRRTVSLATRYVFFSQEQDWIINLVNKNKVRLNLLE